jgi:bifunctional DNA-binding transcriptional regulator/antitoxin component of YhaV-PrlF toxin-antitoxin module
MPRSVVGFSKMFGNGKAQIPKQVREGLGLEDGSGIVWIEEDGRYYLESAELEGAKRYRVSWPPRT